MFFDTHCHLNFQAFDGRVEEVIKNSQSVEVEQIVIPGTDVETSKKAIAIAEKYLDVYAAVGVHPHHVYEFFKASGASQVAKNSIPSLYLKKELKEIENLLNHPKVVAIGEVGIDRHYYEKTKHQNYKVDEKFVDLQKEFLIEQIKLTIKYDKSLILHNREAKKDILGVLSEMWNSKLEHRTVLHCCEPDKELLEFAIEHKIFIGVDGDIAYYKEKQQFIKTVPLKMLVLETDSPYLSPTRQFPNKPKNILIIAKFIAELKNITVGEVADRTTENAKKLFKL